MVVHLILFVDGTKYLTSPDPQEMWKSRHYIVSILIRKGATETLPVGELHSYLSQSKIRKKKPKRIWSEIFLFFSIYSQEYYSKRSTSNLSMKKSTQRVNKLKKPTMSVQGYQTI